MFFTRLGPPCWALACVLATSYAQAFTLNRNEAHLKWRSTETEHFRFHYPAELEPAAEYAAGIAESVAEEKMMRYNLKLPNKVEFILRQDVFSNGWANSLQNTMTVWLTDWDFPIRSTHHWMRDVVTHEFSHLVSIQSGAKLPPFWQGLVLGYEDYFNEPVQGHFATLIPFMAQPNWFAEGVAQYESAHSGFDAWDSHRDMLLRIAAREDKLLNLARMGSFSGTSLEYELGPYTQGFALVRYLGEKYGDAAVIQLWRELSRPHRQTLSGAMERVIGKDGEALYSEWSEALVRQYAAQVKALGDTVQGRKLTSSGFYNYYPRFSHNGKQLYFISNGDRDDFRGSLTSYDLSDSAAKKKEAERLKTLGAIRGFFDVGQDDSTFVFQTAREEDKNGVHHFDIFQRNVKRKADLLPWKKDPTEKRYTENLDAVNPSYSPDGKQVVFVRAELGNFKLCIAPIPDRKKLDPEEVKTIWPPESMTQGSYGFNIYTPRFSPDGKRIAFSYFDGHSRNVGLVNIDGKGFVPLLNRPYDERDPEWSPDGKALYFSADSNNIYNLYRYRFADSGANRLEALTNVIGGAFSPALDSSGRHLAYVGYDKDGFSLYLLDTIRAVNVKPVVYQVHHNDSLKVENQPLAGRSVPYQSIPNRPLLTPMLFGEEASAQGRLARRGEPKWLMGVQGMINDPVLKNEVSGALLLEVGKGIDYIDGSSELLNPNKESQAYLSWRNHSLPVTLGAAFSRGNITSSDTVKEFDKTPGVITVKEQPYSLVYRDVSISAAYDLFDATSIGEEEKTSFLQMTGGYGWNTFNFYDLGDGSGFAFDYYRTWYLNTLVWLYGADYNDKGLVAPSGAAAYLSHTYSASGIIRQGTFQESFVFNDKGVIEPRLRKYNLNEIDGGATYGTPLPWSKNSSLALSTFAGALASWKFTNRDTLADTLDSFFEKGLWLRGYPYLRNIENLAFSGENTLKFSADLNQPLIPDIYRSFWVLFVEDLYINAFWEAGRAWNGDFYRTRLFDAKAWSLSGADDAWFQSLGWGLKLNSRIYHNYPFLAYFEAATALSGIPDGQGGRENLASIRMPIGRDTKLNTFATRISFGVAFGLYNGLLGHKGPDTHPARPHSIFSAR